VPVRHHLGRKGRFVALSQRRDHALAKFRQMRQREFASKQLATESVGSPKKWAMGLKSANAIAIAHLIRCQPTLPRIKAPMSTRAMETIPRRKARGTLWASFAPYQEPPLKLAARMAPKAKSSLP
jgi:hypothetical protein